MKLELKLSHKGMILVSVPLLFECLFLIVLCIQLNEADAAINLQIKAREITSQVDKLSNLFLEADISQGGFNATHSPLFKDRYESLLKEIPETLSHINQLLAKDPKRQTVLEKVNSAAKVGLAALAQSDETPTNGQNGDELTEASLHSTMRFIADSLNRDLLEATKEERRVHELAPALQQKRRESLFVSIIASAIVSVFITLLLALFFTREIGRRLAVVNENSKRLSSGKPLAGAVGGNDEITELDNAFREMAVSLDAARERERAVVDNAIDLICSIDAAGRFRAANPASLPLLGYASGELIETLSYADIVVPEDFENARKSFSTIMDKGKEATFEVRVKRKDASVKDTSWSARWSADQKCLFCVVHDISERKAAERLRQEVTAMITHDLRSPLTTIVILLEMLQSDKPESVFGNNKRLVNAAEQSTKQMMTLIDDLLDIEKIKSGMMKLEIEQVTLQSIFKAAVETASGVASKYSVSIEVQETPLILKVDPERISRVLVNLLSNAAKFSPKGAVVKLTTDDSENFVKIHVIDQGRGIPADMIDKIFDRFHQVESSDHSKKGGSGLGLSICKSIVEMHGGTMQVTSQLGKGSVFTLSLPK